MITGLVTRELAEPTELLFCKIFVFPKCNTTLQDALEKALTSYTGHPIWLQTATLNSHGTTGSRSQFPGRDTLLVQTLYVSQGTSTRHGAF
jgi:hypothetical protein